MTIKQQTVKFSVVYVRGVCDVISRAIEVGNAWNRGAHAYVANAMGKDRLGLEVFDMLDTTLCGQLV